MPVFVLLISDLSSHTVWFHMALDRIEVDHTFGTQATAEKFRQKSSRFPAKLGEPPAWSYPAKPA
jgi:hypothetical protein